MIIRRPGAKARQQVRESGRGYRQGEGGPPGRDMAGVEGMEPVSIIHEKIRRGTILTGVTMTALGRRVLGDRQLRAEFDQALGSGVAELEFNWPGWTPGWRPYDREVDA